MNSSFTAQLHRIAAFSVLAISLLAGPVLAASPLATPDQEAVEKLALKLLASPEIKKQMQETHKRFLADPAANTPEGKQTMQNAIDEIAFSAALGAANSDPARPKVIWNFTAPRTWLGRHVPGSRWGGENPDNVYRFIWVDEASRYEITGHIKQPAPMQFSFMLYDTYAGENTKQSGYLDTPIAGLRDVDIQMESDGTFKLTLDSSPADGRPNHMQSNADARILVIRNSFADWNNQNPLEIQVRRVGGPEPAKPASEKELARLAANLMVAATNSMFKLKDTIWEKAEPNTISKPWVRGGGWGFGAYGKYKFGDDEALLVTLDPLGAKYMSMVTSNQWLVTNEHIHASGNLNKLQAQANNDGSYTYVISAKDPGIHNWLDTSGLHEGKIQLRWQVLPQTTTSADGAVREVKLVKLAELPQLLPAETVKVTPEQRQALYAQRALAYAHRYSSD